MKYIISTMLFLTFFMTTTHTKAADLRSDTIDIHHILIHLNITDFAGKTINGYATVRFSPRVSNVSNLNLDLLKLNVDSIKLGANTLTYSYNDTLLGINLGGSHGPTDTLEVTVFYSGKPQIDQSNWGGFYFQGDYAYNLGVGFAADPHNYGRIWFPCFDNFVERNTYAFEIITADSRKSYCNGELVSETALSGDTIMRTWVMNESIPSYLACVAVSNYAEVKWNHQGLQKNIPVLVAVKESDTTKLKNSFANLNNAIDAFEESYGPFLFNKVGYSIVPFTGGAMEHASNITYPNFAVNGNLAYETLMAHEFAHHWWGDLVTCDSQEEMWINEGMASYSEHLFLDYVYGHQRYIDAVKANHLNVIQYAHITEGKYWAITGLPHEYTYGMHVYKKGAVVAHNLRTYLGDTLFKSGLTQFIDNNKFTDVNSIKFRDDLEQSTGSDLHDFFDDWVLNGGFAHFAIDSFSVSPSPGLNSVAVYIRQKQRGSNHFYNNVPLTLSFYDSSYNLIERKVKLSGSSGSFTFTMPISPTSVFLNSDDALNMAVTADEMMLHDTAMTYQFDNGKMQLDLTEAFDSTLFRVEHHWAAPDAVKDVSKNYRISDYRYWNVTGVFPGKLSAKAKLYFDGRDIRSGGQGNLDNDLLKNGADSLILLYRNGPEDDWEEYRAYTKTVFSGSKFGFVTIENLKEGQYTYANGVSTVGINKLNAQRTELRLSPNPVSDRLKVEHDIKDTSNKELVVYNVQGKLIHQQILRKKNEIDVSTWKSGSYFIVLLGEGTQLFSGQFVVSR